ncbi:hypothetical protein B7937_18570, partial [Vibrio cholerae]
MNFPHQSSSLSLEVFAFICHIREANLQAYTQTLIHRLDKLNRQRIERALALMDLQSQRVFHL